ncbi:MAG: hypothetical protein FJ215_03955 [Ignavibacteria bacterium]|nr:hypothetical protein [Ignavibacteria bacterium]
MNQSTGDSQNSIGNTIFADLTRRDAVWLALLLGVGLAARVLFIGLSDHTIASDEIEYHSLASSLAENGTYAIDGKPTAYRPPGYPFFVASLYALCGSSPITVKLLQAILDVFTGLLLFFLTAGRSARSGFAAAIVWMFFVPALFYANLLFSETLFAFLLVLLAFVVTRSVPHGLARSFLTGLLLGLLTLVKPWMILFAAFWIGYSLWRGDRTRDVLLSSTLFLMLLAPWVIRNAVTFGTPALSLNGGMNLYIGHNPHTTGGYKGIFPHELTALIHDEVALDSTARAMALGYLIDHPGTTVINAFKKIGHLFSSEGELLVFTFSNDGPLPPLRYAERYAALPLSLIAVTNLPSMVILFLGLAGIVSLPRDHLWFFVVGMALVIVATSIVFFGGSRFHFPLMPFLTIFACVFVSNSREALRSLTTVQWIVLISLLSGCISVWLYEIITLAAV